MSPSTDSRIRKRRPAAFEQLLEKLPATLDRFPAEVAPIEPHEVERGVADPRVPLAPREPLLKSAERRPARLVDDARLAVDDTLARREFRYRVRDRAETFGPIVRVARVETNVAPGLAREESIAVVFDLEEPLGRVGDRGHGGCQRRLAHGVEQAARALARFRGADTLRTTRGDPSAHDRLRTRSDDVVGRIGLRVLGFEKEPLRLAAAARTVVSSSPIGADEVPVADELFAKETNMDVSLVEHGVLLARRDRLVGPAVPDEHVPGAILLVRDASLELVVRHGVVLGLDRQPANDGVVARPLGHRPADHGAVDLEPEVVMQAARVVLLNDEGEALPFGYRGNGRTRRRSRRFLFPGGLALRRFVVRRRLGRHAEATLRTVCFQSIAALMCSARLARLFFRRRSLSDASFLVR